MYNVIIDVKLMLIWIFECNRLCLHLRLSRDFVQDRDFSVYELAHTESSSTRHAHMNWWTDDPETMPLDLSIGHMLLRELLSLTYKVLTTTQPSYLHNLITVPQRLCSIHSSSLVTLARLSTSSSLRITDCSFQYASPRLGNQLPASVCEPCTISLQFWHLILWVALLSSVLSTHHPRHLSPIQSFIPGLKPFFSANPQILLTVAFFSTSGLTSRIPRTVYQILLSIHFGFLFYFLVFGSISCRIEWRHKNYSSVIHPGCCGTDVALKVTWRCCPWPDVGITDLKSQLCMLIIYWTNLKNEIFLVFRVDVNDSKIVLNKYFVCHVPTVEWVLGRLYHSFFMACGETR